MNSLRFSVTASLQPRSQLRSVLPVISSLSLPRQHLAGVESAHPPPCLLLKLTLPWTCPRSAPVPRPRLLLTPRPSPRVLPRIVIEEEYVALNLDDLDLEEDDEGDEEDVEDVDDEMVSKID